jgi:hypothetical protein
MSWCSGKRHLRHLLRSYAAYYNQARTHLSLGKDAPLPRPVHATGRIIPRPFLGGLHHQYFRALISDKAQVMVATQRFDPSASITRDSLLKTAAHFRIARAVEFIKGSPT